MHGVISQTEHTLNFLRYIVREEENANATAASHVFHVNDDNL
jgi:hypothetical protein